MRSFANSIKLQAAIALLILFFVSVNLTQAVQPKKWTHTTEADFEPGETDATLVTNLGDVKLTVDAQTIGEMPEQATVLFDIQTLKDGSIYIAAGPEAKLLKREGDEIKTVLSLKGEQIFSLDVTDEGKLLMGISGESSRLAILEDGEAKTICQLEGTRYIWDMVVREKTVYLATGIEGKMLRVQLGNIDIKDNKPTVTTLLEAKQTNLLCIGMDDAGRIYAGSDTDGLVYRVTLDDEDKPTAFVMFDAPEPEIGALLVQPNGVVYAGTADADQARAGRLSKASQTQTGRPEVKTVEPKAPADPDPKPQEPDQEPAKADAKEPVQAEEAADPADIPDARKQPVEKGDKEAGTKKAQPPKAPSARGLGDDEPLTGQLIALIESQNGALVLQANSDKAPAQQQAEKPEADNQQPAAPTAEERDALRSVIRERLEAARDTGNLQASPGGFSRQTPKPAGSSRRASVPKPSQPKTKGNAIYKISPQGFVGTVFRESVMILNIQLDGTTLVVGTGNEGQIFRVDPSAQERTILAVLEPQQITSMLMGPDGSILVATSNPATLVRFSSGFAKQGSYTSQILDAQQISLFGALNVVADIPEGASVHIQTRSGNVADPELGPWSEWKDVNTLEHDDKAAALAPREGKVASPPARYLQYRVNLKAENESPVLDEVNIAYVMPNLRPSVRAIVAKYGKASSKSNDDVAPEHQSDLELTWQAVDPNEDKLTYRIEYRFAGSEKWIELAKDLDKEKFEWHTVRVPDGRYVVRVIANDEESNPPGSELSNSRTSDPILIDNTAPIFTDIKGGGKDGSVVIQGEIKDALSPIKSVAYTIDSADGWVSILPKDAIFDSTSETILFKISGLSPGQHVVTLRGLDEQNNAVYKAVIVNN